MTDGAVDSLRVKLNSVAGMMSYGSDIAAWRLTHGVTCEGQLSNIQILSCPLSSLARSTKLRTECHCAILINYNKEFSNRNLSCVAKIWGKVKLYFSLRTSKFSKVNTNNWRLYFKNIDIA